MLLTIIVFFAVLSVIVLAHESGHFLTALKFGAQVEEFGLGLPPKIFGLERKGIIYSVNWLPIGGFVKIKGENGEDRESTDSFAAKKIWQRAVILAAGVIMNVVLCAILLMICFGLGMPSTVEGQDYGAIVSDRKIQIVEVLKDTSAAAAGLKIGDQILTVNGQSFATISELQNYLQDKGGQTVNLAIKSDGQTAEKSVGIAALENRVGMGVALMETALVRYPWYLAIWQGIKNTGLWLILLVSAFYQIIHNLLIGAPAGAEVAGPVGIAVLTGQAARLGLVYVLQFMALLSLNLAIINILPFPALDGGRLLFLLIEKLRRRPLKQSWENVVNSAGFALLMILIFFVTFKDVVKYGAPFWGVLKKIVGL